MKDFIYNSIKKYQVPRNKPKKDVKEKNLLEKPNYKEIFTIEDSILFKLQFSPKLICMQIHSKSQKFLYRNL